jgi:hypothetical protein
MFVTALGIHALRTFFDAPDTGGSAGGEPPAGDPPAETPPAGQQAEPPAGDPPAGDKPEVVAALEAANVILTDQYKELLNGAPAKVKATFETKDNPLHERIPQIKAAIKEHEELKASLRDEVQTEVQAELDTKYGKGLIDVKKGPIIKADAPPAVATGDQQNAPGEQAETKHKLMDPETLNSFGDWDDPHAIHRWGKKRAETK